MVVTADGSAFSAPFFKVLTKTDCGKSRSRQAALYIPVDLSGCFPLLQPSSSDPVPSESLRLVFVDSRGCRTDISARYEMQTRNLTRSEARLTGTALSRLLHCFNPGDILLIEPDRGDVRRYRIQVVAHGTQKELRLRKRIGDRRSGAVPGYRSTALDEAKWLVARLERIEALSTPGRFSFEFDGIDAATPADDLVATLDDPRATGPFALLRVTAKKKQLSARLNSRAAEGMWVEIEITPRRARSRIAVEIAQLTPSGYTETATGFLGEMRLLAGPDEPPKPYTGVGASAAGSRQRADAIMAACGMPSGTPPVSADVLRVLRRKLSKAYAIRVRDVGQASFATICSKAGDELIHFDAGWPISFNGKTAPTSLPTVKSAPVILSHWDWDHLHAWHAVPELRSVQWIVPRQPIGPGATKVAKALHAKSLLVAAAPPAPNLGAATLITCTGPSGMNDTGLALELKLASGKIALLVGDAGYDHLGTTATGGPYDLLIATHHGANFTGSVPRANGRAASCVVSVGRGNVYGHPSTAAIKLHEKSGWTISQTRTVGSAARGDRTLF